MERIAFIGVGIMGTGMVRNLMKAGYELHIFARRPEKVEAIVSEGAILHSSISECVSSVDAVITMVGFPADVEEVYFGNGNILDSAREGLFLIDMTTTSPKLAKRIYVAGKEKNIHVLDAPVTGGDIGAKNGTLSILVGGEKNDYDKCHALFEAMGTNINYMGPAGAGQHAKLGNQILITGTIASVCEALTYVGKEGLNLDTFINAVENGAAGSNQLKALGKKMIVADYAPGFFIKHFIKDMKLAVEEAKEVGCNLDVLESVLSKYLELGRDYGDLGTQALIDYYKKKNLDWEELLER